MIKAEVRCNQTIVMTRIYDDPCLTLAQAMKRIEGYVVDERLNEDGECAVRVVFCQPVAVAI